VYRLRDDLAVVLTLDFFMPIVDDPYDFGRIAAANAISDVYAMGAEPITALAILGYPVKKLPHEVATAIMAGGAEVCREAGIVIAGGHSIDDTEPKFGLAVTGVVHPDQVLRNDTGGEGDLLVLTKPLGVGAVAHGLKKGVVAEAVAAEAVRVMTALNRGASVAARRVGVSAATDVTGFALLGHALEMADGAGLAVELWVDALPVLDGVRDLLAAGIHAGATTRNLDACGPSTTWGDGVDEVDRKLVADPQTSGGLLLAVPPARVDALIAALSDEGTLAAAVVGRLVAGRGARVVRSGGG
jgi:selenide,water dikinase